MLKNQQPLTSRPSKETPRESFERRVKAFFKGLEWDFERCISALKQFYGTTQSEGWLVYKAHLQHDVAKHNKALGGRIINGTDSFNHNFALGCLGGIQDGERVEKTMLGFYVEYEKFREEDVVKK